MKGFYTMLLLIFLLLMSAFIFDGSCFAFYAVQETTRTIQKRPAVVPNPVVEGAPLRKVGPGVSPAPLSKPRVVKSVQATKIEISPEAEQMLRDYESARETNNIKLMKEIHEKLTKLGIEIPE